MEYYVFILEWSKTLPSIKMVTKNSYECLGIHEFINMKHRLISNHGKWN